MSVRPTETDHKNNGFSTPRMSFEPVEPLTEEQILWAQSVKYHAESQSIESRGSLRELAKTVPNTDNVLLLEVIKAVEVAVTTQFTNLKDLQIKTTTLMRSINLISPPCLGRSLTPAFFHDA